MPASDEQEFKPDRRGNRLERYRFWVEPGGQSHRLYLRAVPEIAKQFSLLPPPTPPYQLAAAGMPWTHCLRADGVPHTGARGLAELLSDVLTLRGCLSAEFVIAMNWYKVPAEDVDSRDWSNTLDGSLVSTGKYWRSSPEAMKQAGRRLTQRMLDAARKHPVLASTDVVVAAPGHDRSLVSFGERLGVSIATGLGVPCVKVETSEDFRPPSKALSRREQDELRGEFYIREDLTGATVLIVDDVFHTGGTMSVVSSAAALAGAERTCGFVAVRTIRS